MVANRTRRTPSRRAFRQEFTLRQQSPGEFDAATGIYNPGSFNDYVLNGSFQPPSVEVISQLTENERLRDPQEVFTNGLDANGTIRKIRPVRFGDTSQTQGDLIIYDDVIYNVVNISDFNVHGHQEVVVVRSEQQLEPVETIWDGGATTWDNGSTVWDI